MSTPPIGSVGGINGISSIKPSARTANPLSTTGTSDAKSGTNVFSELIQSANQQQVQADQAVQDLANGSNQSLHDVVLSAAKADLSFRLVLEMRNKLTDAYQEIMRMQV